LQLFYDLSFELQYMLPGEMPGHRRTPGTPNIINEIPDASRSLYHRCLTTKYRLGLAPNFTDYMALLEENVQCEGILEGLWVLFRPGFPLLTIYNITHPKEPVAIKIPTTTDSKVVQKCRKTAIFSVYSLVRGKTWHEKRRHIYSFRVVCPLVE
jgi:hypothetical protein